MKVFISYCHEENIPLKVLELSDKLVKNGIDCSIDQYNTFPPEGWHKWMDKEISSANYVLVVCSKSYLSRCNNEDFNGKGIHFESTLTFNEIYQNYSKNSKFIPVIFSDAAKEFIPNLLEPFTFYNLETDSGYQDLYRVLTNQPKIKKPQKGNITELPTAVNLLDDTSSSISLSNNDDSDVIVDIEQLGIELTIDRDFATYSNQEKEALLSAIKKLLEIKGDLKIKRIRRGSVIMKLELSPAQCEKLYWAIKSGSLSEFDVVDSKIIVEEPEKFPNQHTVVSQHTVAEVWLNKSTHQQSLHALIHLRPGDRIADFSAGELLSTPTYLTLQVGLHRHILLMPRFLTYINHSCNPNVFFDTTFMEVVCLKDIYPGEELRCFYPSTEWELSQPFVCNCGSEDCLQYISGAAFLSDKTLSKYRLSDFIKKQLEHKL